MIKKILIVDTNIEIGGGSGKSLSEVLNNLDFSKIEPTLLTFYKSKAEYPLKKIRRIFLNKNYPRSFFATIWLIFFYFPIQIYLIWRRNKFDIIITNHSHATWSTNILKLFYPRIKSFAIIRGAWKDYNYGKKKERFSKTKFIYNLSNKLITVSKSLEERIKVHLPKKKVITIYNPFDIKNIQKQMKEPLDDASEKKLFSENEVILNVGRMHEQKNQIFLIESLSEILKKGSNIKLVILGEGKLKKKIIKKIKELQLQEHVALLGVKKNVYKYMYHSKIFVLSSNYEGLPRTLIEAISCGLPSISSNCLSGPSEILNNTTHSKTLIKSYRIMKYGVLFEENNSDGLIEAVTLLLENKKTYLKLKNKSFERAQFFDKENVIKKWEYELLN